MSDSPPPSIGFSTLDRYESPSATEALRLALIGIPFGFLTAPLAIARAVEAKRQIARNPTMTGLAKANLAIGISFASLALALVVVYRMR